MCRHLRKEAVDFEGADAAAGITIEACEGGEGLEIGVAGEGLSLSLDEDFLFGDCLQEVLKLKLGFNSNHFIFIFAIIFVATYTPRFK